MQSSSPGQSKPEYYWTTLGLFLAGNHLLFNGIEQLLFRSQPTDIDFYRLPPHHIYRPKLNIYLPRIGYLHQVDPSCTRFSRMTALGVAGIDDRRHLLAQDTVGVDVT